MVGISDESDDQFEAVGDYNDSATGETLVSDDLLSPSSASLILHANGDPNAAEMDSLLNHDLDCVDGKDITQWKVLVSLLFVYSILHNAISSL